MIKTILEKIKTKDMTEASSFKTLDDVIKALFDIEANVKGHYGKLAGDAAEALQNMVSESALRDTNGSSLSESAIPDPSDV